ncbi:MAG: GNAT family N-acetyltransferase, partial [Candidatus Thorarchaeota archaeon]
KLDIICSICLDPSVDKKTRDLMENGMDERISWIKEMIPNGLGILVASEKPRQEEIHYKWVGKMLHSDLTIHGRVYLGLLEYVPIKHALEPIDGKNSLFINCIWILPPFWHMGTAKALLKSFIERAKQYGSASVIAYEGDNLFGTSIKYMPISFFKKFGFKEVDRDGSRVLLYLDLGSSSSPKLIFPKLKEFNKAKKLQLDIFSNSQCPWSKYMINTVKKEAEKYANINLNFHKTDNPDLIKDLGISRGIYLNGKPIIERMASWEEIKLKLDKSIKEYK